MRAMQTSRMSPATLALPGLATITTGRVSKRRILYAGPLAVLTAVAATLLARAAAVAILPPLNPAFVEMQPQSVAFVTGFLCAIAVGVFALMAFVSKRPLRTFAIVSAVALVLSWIPDGMIFSESVATPAGVVALMVLHAVAAVAVVYPLMALTRDA